MAAQGLDALIDAARMVARAEIKDAVQSSAVVCGLLINAMRQHGALTDDVLRSFVEGMAMQSVNARKAGLPDHVGEMSLVISRMLDGRYKPN